MLKRTKNFFKTTILGGIIVILPTIILVFAFKWLFGFVADAIRPLTNLVVDNITLPDSYDQVIATLIVLTVIVLGCFLVGLFVRTRIGRWIYEPSSPVPEGQTFESCSPLRCLCGSRGS